MTLVYLGALLVSAACLVLLDMRFSLVFRRRPKAAAAAVGIAVAFFVVWDAVGILFGVFRHQDSAWATGVLLAPHFPVEELVFLIFLSYFTLIVLSVMQRWAEQRERS